MARPRVATHAQGHVPRTEDVDALKPFFDRRIPVTSTVRCPVHNVEIGEPCRSASGKLVNCQPRRRQAIRILRERGEM